MQLKYMQRFQMFYFLLQDCILHARDENALLHIPLTIQYNKSIDNRLLYYPCKDSLFQKRTCIEMFQELALLAALCQSVDRFSCCCPTNDMKLIVNITQVLNP